jgi:hypothetical protein
MSDKITISEINRLKALEKIISAGQKTFIAVGEALTEIRDNKLYRAEHGTFEKYCERVWGWNKSHAYRVMDAAPVAKGLINETKSPVNLSTATALAKVPPPKRPGIVKQILEAGQKLTAKAISKASAPPPKRPIAMFLDSTGLEIPSEALPLWNRMSEAQGLMTQISVVRSALRRAQDENDPLFVEVDFTDNLAKLNQVFLDLQRAKPYAVCPTCSGVKPKGCLTCKGRGFVSEFFWKHNIPTETKELTGRK